MLGTEYKCFQFNEDSLFDKYVGPAYKRDEYYDKTDDGANASNSEWKNYVRKIKIVSKLSDGKYSKEQFAWFYEDSGIIYDLIFIIH